MKIVVNYDLIDKAREAQTGFSLHKYITVVGITSGIAIPAKILDTMLRNMSTGETVMAALKILAFILFYNGFQAKAFSSFNKENSNDDLTELAKKLGNICIETDSELLKKSYRYDIKYSINFDAFPPKLEQKKYIMVPVHNNWNNNERSLVQEHVVGTRQYALSYGEPEKEKIYSFGTRKMISK